MMPNDIQTSRGKRIGILALVLLLSMPTVTVWNLYALSYAPKLRVMIGPRLRGVTTPNEPIKFSAKTFTDGSWQKFAAASVSDAYPLRPLLIRINNQIRLKLFGGYAAPGIVVGDNNQLIEQAYLTEYCARNTGVLEAKANEWIPKLRELQDFYEARNHVFIYLITPSKVAYMPEKFFPRIPCANQERDRKEKLPVYTRLLAEAGVHFVDAASLTHNMKGKYKVDLFPQGGVHWNAIGVANATNAVLREIDAQEKRGVTPKLRWSYQVIHKARGEDRDLADLVNVLRPNINYATAKVIYESPGSCANFSAASQKVAVIGGSFISELAKSLAANGCLSKLEGYNYLYRGMRAGPLYKPVKRRLTSDDIKPLRDADVVILEENESVAPESAHASEFYRVILEK